MDVDEPIAIDIKLAEDLFLWKPAFSIRTEFSVSTLDRLLFHDLRRSAVRNMERAGIPRNIAMAIGGHKTEAVYRRYDIVAPGDLEVAAAKLKR